MKAKKLYQEDMKMYMNFSEAARHLKVSRSRIQSWVSGGHIKSIRKIGTRFYIDNEEIQRIDNVRSGCWFEIEESGSESIEFRDKSVTIVVAGADVLRDKSFQEMKKYLAHQYPLTKREEDEVHAIFERFAGQKLCRWFVVDAFLNIFAFHNWYRLFGNRITPEECPDIAFVAWVFRKTGLNGLGYFGVWGTIGPIMDRKIWFNHIVKKMCPGILALSFRKNE